MAEAMAARAAYLGLVPRVADRLNPAELEALLDGSLMRWGRHTRLGVWLLGQSIPFIAHAVAIGINAALGGGKLPRLEEPLDMLRAAPDYRVDDDPEAEEKSIEDDDLPSPFEAPDDDDWEDEEVS